jgi:hypothetical protein
MIKSFCVYFLFSRTMKDENVFFKIIFALQHSERAHQQMRICLHCTEEGGEASKGKRNSFLFFDQFKENNYSELTSSCCRALYTSCALVAIM